MFYSIKWINYLYNSLLKLISNPVVSLIAIIIIYNISIIRIIRIKININNINTIFSSSNIIIISNTSLSTNKVRFKLGIKL